MRKSLDIDMYKNGFGAQHISCVYGPIAASAGHFNYNNYFYFCYLHAILNNTEERRDLGLKGNANRILSYMGLELQSIDCSGYTPEETVNRISEEILGGWPVILVVKYNSLFYNKYYKDSTFTLNHAIIVNEYGENNRTFGIKEASLLRDTVNAYENSDVFFPLQVTFDMLKDIYDESNKQFIKGNQIFANNIYSMRKIDEINIDTNDVINISLSLFQDYKNDLINIINSYNERIKEFAIYIENTRRRFCGCIRPIFHLLYEHCKQRNLDTDLTKNAEKSIEEIRKNVLNILYKASITGTKITKEKQDTLCSMVLDSDEKLINLIKSLYVNEIKKNQINYYVDLTKYYNNQAFEETLNDNSTADITGQGTHYIMQDVVINEEWKKGGYSFIYRYSAGKMDNISCESQIIWIPNINARYISILGCAEFGNYREEIEIEFSDGTKQSITADFTDFYQSAIYEEEIYWIGAAAERKNGKTNYQNFNARLFAKRYPIKSGRVAKLTLPRRRNVHIFALTLTDEV
ncbi:hypothetical protein EHE19_014910 [Ruminiclostridium herbifermentans]|uniref:Butirosin biosynthesis protein H N-terminal domain-containing protein n=1 Tax=Ruminiclostridium herbifermentans TaxID=2488810 RepID=A0A4U7JJC2_9FIRM|nr:hypothetical protein [Ruminiclostridium herbifermentans]QNU66156.1 hypothetical protein EHE19_014910 [Ruminiclostridium herbifermentans]